MGSDPAFLSRCRSSFFYYYYCFRPELCRAECRHARELIKDFIMLELRLVLKKKNSSEPGRKKDKDLLN